MEGAVKEHAMNLWDLILRCREVNAVVNPKKFQFTVKQVTWMGHLLAIVMKFLRIMMVVKP